MKTKISKRLFGILITLILVFNVNIKTVKAATAVMEEVGSKYYFYNYSSNSKYGEYYGGSYKTGTAEKYTRYKKLAIGENKTSAIAYCVQSTDKSPTSDATYTEINWGTSFGGKTWTEKQALIAGRIIEKIRADKGDYTTETYVYIFSTLNSLLKLDGSINFAAYNSGMKKYIDDATNHYNNNVKTSTTLPTFAVKASNSGIMDIHVPSTASGTTYYTGSVSLSNLLTSYGGNDITYTVNITTTGGTVGICTTSSCTSTNGTSQKISGVTSKTLYIKATNVTSDDKITVKVTGNNSSTYRIARLWKHSTASTTYQALATYSTKKYSRSKSVQTTFYIPDPGKKTFSVEKVDNVNGESLSGSNLTMNIYEDSSKKTKIASCDITSDKNSCNSTVSDDIANNLYYEIIEKKAPSGYVLGTDISGTWNLTTSSQKCQKSKIGEDNWTETSLTDCDTSYKKGNLCYDKENNIYTEGECEVEVPDSGNEGEVIPGDTTTQVEEGSEETTPGSGTTEQPEEESKFETVEKCYTINNDNITITSDQTKCDYDYLKVTTNKGNLRVQFPNTQNTVKISKQSITSQEEIPGAELKICTTKPNAAGECTIARNTLNGICKADATDTENGGANLTNEFNCEYNSVTDKKTIDMHWYSTDAPKIWNGLPTGTYYLIETLAPRGYIVSTSITEFTIDENGKVTSKSYDEENHQIVLTNELTELTISKIDLATSKELPGATLSICNAYKDSKGNWNKFVNDEGFCNPVVLADGTSATWESTTEPHKIKGLGVGSYYLVETIAPNGYSTAESILFTVNKDGSLSDIDGNSLENNKIIMKDKKIEETKTGDLPILLITIIAFGMICVVSYYINNNNQKESTPISEKIIEKSNKIRKRKIHK